jgi:molybdate/tungstate transport system substrate-binding protein
MIFWNIIQICLNNLLRMTKILLCSLILIFIPGACVNRSSGKKSEIIVFHAGSLAVPLKEISQEYEKDNPGVKILLEAAGSLVCARKITELKKPCDIMASADYFVINELLIPKFTNWGIRFATNEIVIAFLDKSKYSSEINLSNWMDILLRKDVIYTRSDPNSDPCGYRTVFTFILAEKYYDRNGLTREFLSKNNEYIRPKEVDLVALLESNAVDYMFQYKSVAIQHNLKYIRLPTEINLSDPKMNDIYRSVSLNVTGNAPKSTMKVTADYINYSITVLNDAPSKEKAIDFLCFLLSDRGMQILRENGQDPILPFTTEQVDKLPVRLLEFLPQYKTQRSK